MRVSEIASVFDSYYNDLTCVRQFGWGQVVAGAKGGVFILIVQEKGSQRHTLYEYDDADEYLQDVLRVRRFSGGDSAGVPALVGPQPPQRPAHDAKPIPRSEDEWS